MAVANGVAANETQPIPRLEGSWYVLVHYRDQGRDAMGQMQWLDRVWRFEIDGERMRWTILSGVTFRDARGRIELIDGGRSARSLGAWEPNEAQLAEIRAGLEVDDHDVRRKTLHGSASAGYRSLGERRSQSTSTIAYHERWQIAAGPDGPVFTRDDSMGSGRTDELSGRTRYTTRAVAEDGAELSGDFDQDGVLLGRFRMLRMSEPRATTATVDPRG
jgi:hypothetical protein